MFLIFLGFLCLRFRVQLSLLLHQDLVVELVDGVVEVVDRHQQVLRVVKVVHLQLSFKRHLILLLQLKDAKQQLEFLLVSSCMETQISSS